MAVHCECIQKNNHLYIMKNSHCSWTGALGHVLYSNIAFNTFATFWIYILKNPHCSWTRALSNVFYSNIAFKTFATFLIFTNDFLHLIFWYLIQQNTFFLLISSTNIWFFDFFQKSVRQKHPQNWWTLRHPAYFRSFWTSTIDWNGCNSMPMID